MYTGRSKQRREFNPFNLRSEEPDAKHRIHFERLGNRVKTRPLWWMIIAFAFAIFLYWYLTNRF